MEGHPTRYGLARESKKSFHWGHEPMTPGYPVLGQGSQIQKNWFQNRIQRPRFGMKGHPTRYGLAKAKIFSLGSRTHDPWISGLGSGVTDTEKLVSKSDSATLIWYGRTPNTIWFGESKNFFIGVTNP